jgi:hypothetical protein
MNYQDGYPSCAYTHVWFRIAHQDLQPAAITRLLGVRPSKAHPTGVSVRLWESAPPRKAKMGGWWLETEGQVKSFDARRHIDWVLDRLDGKGPTLRKLLRKGYLVDLCCVWHAHSDTGGGPTLSPAQLTRLAKLGIDLWFDIYFPVGAARLERAKRKDRTTESTVRFRRP